jgi:hypothetical protein
MSVWLQRIPLCHVLKVFVSRFALQAALTNGSWADRFSFFAVLFATVDKATTPSTKLGCIALSCINDALQAQKLYV